MISDDDIRRRFRYYPPRDEATRLSHEAIRDACMALALAVNDLAPDSGEKTIAIGKIEEAMMWANAALARHGSRSGAFPDRETILRGIHTGQSTQDT